MAQILGYPLPSYISADIYIVMKYKKTEKNWKIHTTVSYSILHPVSREPKSESHKNTTESHKNTTVSAAMLQPATKTPLWVLPCCSQQQKHHCDCCHVVASYKNTTVSTAMLSQLFVPLMSQTRPKFVVKVSNASWANFFCSSVVKSRPTWPHQELKFKR